MPDLQVIIQGGAVGISVFLIILIAFIIKKVFCFMGNHINSNTETSQKLISKIEQDIEIGKETHKLLRIKNGK